MTDLLFLTLTLNPWFLFGGLVAGGAVYFLPALIASGREHPQRVAIFWLTFLAGWTFAGWVAAFVWAVLNFRHTPVS